MWAERARERGMPADLATADLFTPKAFQAVALKAVEGAAQAADPVEDDSMAMLRRLNAGL